MATASSPLTTTATPPPVRYKKPRLKRLGDAMYPYGYIAPSVAFMVVASFFPIAFSLIIAFTNYGGSHLDISTIGWVGWSNFQQVISTSGSGYLPDFAAVFAWTFIFAGVSTLLNFAGGLFLATLLNNENMWERNLYRTILIIPWALPGTIAVLAWGGILSGDGGLLNSILIWMHLQPVYFLLDANWARFWVIVVNFWLGYPFMMTACLGALQSISPEVLQAAEIDGANAIQKFFRVVLPLLRVATLPLIISTFAYNLNNFGVVYLLTGGGPTVTINRGATDILSTFIYNLAIGGYKLYSLAAAFGVFVFFIVGGISAINMKLSGAFEQVN